MGRGHQLKKQYFSLALFITLLVFTISIPSSFVSWGMYRQVIQNKVKKPPANSSLDPSANQFQPLQTEIKQSEEQNISEPSAQETSNNNKKSSLNKVKKHFINQRHIVLGYYTIDYPGDKASYFSVKNYGKDMDLISVFAYQVDGYGNLTSLASNNDLYLAFEKGVTPLALIHNYRYGSFNSYDTHSLLTSNKNRKKLIRNTIDILFKYGYKGVNIDIENIPPYDRYYYSLLVREFKEALEPLGYLTVVSIPAKTWDDPYNPWSGGFDYKTIGKYADYVQIMTYDEHFMGNEPGPIASLPWVENVIRYAVSLIDREKVLLGIATYGYDWSYSGTTSVRSKSIYSLVKNYNTKVRWSSTYQVPYFYYYKNGLKHEVWFESADSVSLKFDLVNKYGLKGIGIWNLGSEEPRFWDIVKEKL